MKLFKIIWRVWLWLRIIWSLMSVTRSYAVIFYEQCLIWFLTGTWMTRRDIRDY